jgi:hypothetical protein
MLVSDLFEEALREKDTQWETRIAVLWADSLRKAHQALLEGNTMKLNEAIGAGNVCQQLVEELATEGGIEAVVR